MGIADKTKQPDEKAQEGTPAPDKRVAGNEEHTEERTYSQKEVDALLGKSGGKMKAQLELVSRERDDFRTKHEAATKTHQELTSQIEEAKEQIESLKFALEALGSEDAAKAKQLIRDWQKRLEGLSERERNLTPREERVNNFERTELVYTVADEYGLDEPDAKDKFKAAADRLQIKDREGLNTLAETMGLKPKGDEEAEAEPEQKPKAPKPYSGKSDGGTPYFTKAQISDRTFWSAHKDEILKAQREGRIRD
jgi:uncharacterized membrane-anchored protein YhcB (DUF1043 family)